MASYGPFLVLVHTEKLTDFILDAALAVYEYVITFDREVETMWKRKFTVATFLWFMVSFSHA